MHQLRSISTELQTQKSDRKDFNDLRVKVLSTVDNKADTGEVQSAISNFKSDHTQRLLELRGELTHKLQEIAS